MSFFGDLPTRSLSQRWAVLQILIKSSKRQNRSTPTYHLYKFTLLAPINALRDRDRRKIRTVRKKPVKRF